jgi:hypothetical protein
MPDDITIKPHHYLDILKLYGGGIENFVPDEVYKHDFYHVGNIILCNPHIILNLRIGADTICKTCIFSKNGVCTDYVQMIDDKKVKKEEWNKTIDQRILKNIGLKEGVEITALALCFLYLDKLKPSIIREIWAERPTTETEQRIVYTIGGLTKYRNCHS